MTSRERKHARRALRRQATSVLVACPAGCGGQITEEFDAALFQKLTILGTAAIMRCPRCAKTFARYAVDGGKAPRLRKLVPYFAPSLAGAALVVLCILTKACS